MTADPSLAYPICDGAPKRSLRDDSSKVWWLQWAFLFPLYSQNTKPGELVCQISLGGLAGKWFGISGGYFGAKGGLLTIFREIRERARFALWDGRGPLRAVGVEAAAGGTSGGTPSFPGLFLAGDLFSAGCGRVDLESPRYLTDKRSVAGRPRLMQTWPSLPGGLGRHCCWVDRDCYKGGRDEWLVRDHWRVPPEFLPHLPKPGRC